MHCVVTTLHAAPTQWLRTTDILADTDNEGRSVLHIAVNNGSIEVRQAVIPKVHKNDNKFWQAAVNQITKKMIHQHC